MFRNRLLAALHRVVGTRFDSPIARNSAWLISDRVIRAALMFPTTILVARYLGATQFGSWNFATAWIAVFAVFSSLGIESIVVRDLVNAPHRAAETLAAAFAMRVISGVLFTTASITLAVSLLGGDTTTITVIAVLSGTLITQSCEIVDYWFQSKTQSRDVIRPKLLVLLVGSLAKIALIALHAPLPIFAIEQLAESTVLAWFLYSTLRRDWGFSPTINLFRWSVAVPMLRAGAPLFASAIAVVLYMKLDVVLLTHLSTLAETGHYAAATRLSEFWYAIPMALTASNTPALLNAFLAADGSFESRITHLYRIVFRFGLIVAIATSLAGQFVITALFGDAYRAATPTLLCHIWALIPVGLGVVSSQYLVAANLQWISFYRTLIGLTVNVALNIALIPSLGAMGAALSAVAAYSTATLSIGLFKPSRRQIGLMARAILPTWSR